MTEYGADEVMFQDVPGVEDRVRGMLDEARIHLEDAIDTLREVAKLSHRYDGPYWLHGQLESYTIPWLGTFVEIGAPTRFCRRAATWELFWTERTKSA